MKLVEARSLLARIFTLGIAAFLGASWINCLAVAQHNPFPWTLWFFGLYWFWDT